MTAAWLARVFADAGLPGGERIVAVDTEVIGEDRGFTGVVARIRPRYSQAVEGAPLALIGKFPLAERADVSSYRDLQASSPELARAYIERSAREIAFYRAVGQTLPQIPRCYYGHADPEAGQIVLLLEDLAAGAPGDALTGCSVAEARSVLSCVAALHAGWWARDSLAALDWPGDWPPGNPGRVERYRRQAETVVARYGQQLPAGIGDLLLALRDHLDGILDRLAAAPRTLIHLDLHLDNITFMPSEDGQLAYVLDWQSVSRGPAVLDVAGFIVESLGIADRRAHEPTLLREYHAELRDRGVTGYTFEQLQGDYLRALLVRLAGNAGWLARVEIEELQGRERALAEAILDPGRLFAALVDHGVGGRLGELARRP